MLAPKTPQLSSLVISSHRIHKDELNCVTVTVLYVLSIFYCYERSKAILLLSMVYIRY